MADKKNGGLRTEAMHFIKKSSKEWSDLFSKLQLDLGIIGQYDNCYKMLQNANDAIRELSKSIRHWNKFDCKNVDQMRTIKDQMEDVKTWLRSAELNINYPLKG